MAAPGVPARRRCRPASNITERIDQDLAADGGTFRELLWAPTNGLRGLAWTPNGRHVLYVRVAGSKQCELWRADVQTGETKPTGLAHAPIISLRLAPDGRHVVFGAGEWRNEVWVLENAFPVPRLSLR